VRRGRAQTVSSLRAKFDMKAIENASRTRTDRSNKLRRRSASLQPLTECEQQEEAAEFTTERRGRRSSTSGIDSGITRSCSHSPAPTPNSFFQNTSGAALSAGAAVKGSCGHRPRADAMQMQAGPFLSSMSLPLPTPTPITSVPASRSAVGDDEGIPAELHTPEETVETVAHHATADKDFWYLKKYEPDSEKKVNTVY
jgi:hypothetical protein